jgi:hypothetical protein
MIGRDWRLRTAASTGLLFIPGCLRCRPWMKILTGANSQVFYPSSQASPSAVRRSCQQTSLLQPPVLAGFLPALRHPQVLSDGPAIRDISRASGRWAKEMTVQSVHPRETSRDLLDAVKSYIMGLPALLPIRRNVSCGFLSSLKSIALARLEPSTFGSSGKHTNHFTTIATVRWLKIQNSHTPRSFCGCQE